MLSSVVTLEQPHSIYITPVLLIILVLISYDRYVQREASLYACQGDSAEERLKGGRATLTTHRILWARRSRGNWCIHLKGKSTNRVVT